MAATNDSLHCPFCDFVDTDSYFLLQHVELIHPENGESPFLVKDMTVADQGLGRDCHENFQTAALSNGRSLLPPSQVDQRYIPCPYRCGESILSGDLSVHSDLHMAESMAVEGDSLPTDIGTSTGPYNDVQPTEEMVSSFNTHIPQSLRNLAPTQQRASVSNKRKRPSLREMFLGSPASPKDRAHCEASPNKIRRLGRSELGPYAHEKQMPSWLRKMLEDGAKVTISNQLGPGGTIVRVETIENETAQLVPVLARLSDMDRSVERAFYCCPNVQHVSKMPKEGGFCGYRNIQMLISYIRDSRSEGYRHFYGRIPSILVLQDLIENAWDMGINTLARSETGGIRLTRKYIGTPEAQALFVSLEIPCETSSYTSKKDMSAHENLLLAVGNYYWPEGTMDHSDKVTITRKPPVYFQHRGHSMTIVGLEIRKDGRVNLVVFDPMFQPSPAVKKLVNSNSFRVEDPKMLLKAYRRGESYLSAYDEFEILKLASSPPPRMKEV